MRPQSPVIERHYELSCKAAWSARKWRCLSQNCDCLHSVVVKLLTVAKPVLTRVCRTYRGRMAGYLCNIRRRRLEAGLQTSTTSLWIARRLTIRKSSTPACRNAQEASRRLQPQFCESRPGTTMTEKWTEESRDEPAESCQPLATSDAISNRWFQGQVDGRFDPAKQERKNGKPEACSP